MELPSAKLRFDRSFSTVNTAYAWRMTKKGAEEISGSPALQARWARLRRQERLAVPAEMSAVTRDAIIMQRHAEGYTPAEIARSVGMTRRGVAAAISRIRDGRPGRARAE